MYTYIKYIIYFIYVHVSMHMNIHMHVYIITYVNQLMKLHETDLCVEEVLR